MAIVGALFYNALVASDRMFERNGKYVAWGRNK